MRIILGIDPGSRITGYGVIREIGKGQLQYIDSGCIRTSDAPLGTRLNEIFNGICQLLEAYTPNEAAIEEVFLYQNPQAALKLGHARGAAMVACASHRLVINEYSPREVKQALVGYGAAQKEQVKQMVMKILLLSRAPQSDAADALAIAICHSHMRYDLGSLITQTKKRSSKR